MVPPCRAGVRPADGIYAHAAEIRGAAVKTVTDDIKLICHAADAPAPDPKR
jgi:hypothetical protein